MNLFFRDAQSTDSPRLHLGRGIKWQRIEDVPDAEQEAIVRYVLKDKLLGRPITKRV